MQLQEPEKGKESGGLERDKWLSQDTEQAHIVTIVHPSSSCFCDFVLMDNKLSMISNVLFLCMYSLLGG